MMYNFGTPMQGGYTSPTAFGFGGYNPMMMQQQMYNPMSFYNPYGFGGGGMNYGGMGMQSAFDPNSFMNNFQSQLQDMFDKYFSQQSGGVPTEQTEMVSDAKQPGTPAASGGSPAAPAQQTGATTPATPDFGNLGKRFDQGKGLTRKAEKKLNRMGYTDDQIVTAREAGGGMSGFQTALGGMTPTNPNVPAYGSKNPVKGYRTT